MIATKTGKKQLPPFIKYLALIVLSIGGGSIYVVPYLFSTLGTQMQTAFHLNSTTLFGSILTAYGIACTILYLPAGILADKLKSKTLYSFSMIATGVLTVAYAGAMAMTNGGEAQAHVAFGIVILIHIGFAVTTVLTFWSAFIKAVGMLGPVEEHSILYGYSEATKGLAAFVASVVSALITTSLVVSIGEATSIALSLVFLATIYIIVGLLSIIFLPKEGNVRNRKVSKVKRIVSKYPETKYINETSETAVNSKNIKKVFKMPIIWMISILVLFVMIDYDILSFRTSPYFLSISGFIKGTDNYNGLEATLSTVSSIRMYGLAFVFAIIGGFLSSKVIKDTKKTIIIMSIVSMLLIIPFFFVKSGDSVSIGTLWTLITLTLILMFGVAGSRAIYWALIAEGKVPAYLSGVAIGAISIIGFSKDIWFPLITGPITDAHAWWAMWLIFFISSLGALVMTIVIVVYTKQSINIPNEENATKELKLFEKVLKAKGTFDLVKSREVAHNFDKEYIEYFKSRKESMKLNMKLDSLKVKDDLLKDEVKKLEKTIVVSKSKLDKLRKEGKKTFVAEAKIIKAPFEASVIKQISESIFNIDLIVFGDIQREVPNFGKVSKTIETINEIWDKIDFAKTNKQPIDKYEKKLESLVGEKNA